MTLTILILLLGFLLGLVIQKVFPNLCAICFSVSFTWLILLCLFIFGMYVDPIIISVLMGGSAVGVMYYLGAKIKNGYEIFKFPFLASAFALIYEIISQKVEIKALLILTLLWSGFGAVFLFRKKSFSKVALKLIECCKNW